MFIISPETASLKPNTTKVFEVTFRPVKSSFYYFQNLQFFAFKYSSKITKRMIEDIQKNQSRTFSGSFRENLKLSNTLMNSKKSKSYFFASKIVLFIELFPHYISKQVPKIWLVMKRYHHTLEPCDVSATLLAWAHSHSFRFLSSLPPIKYSSLLVLWRIPSTKQLRYKTM